LRYYEPDSDLVRSAENFLKLVTNYEPEFREEIKEYGLSCAVALGASLDGKVDRAKTQGKIKLLLPKLDTCLQGMNQNAAKLVA
jgi:hypothetical protein